MGVVKFYPCSLRLVADFGGACAFYTASVLYQTPSHFPQESENRTTDYALELSCYEKCNATQNAIYSFKLCLRCLGLSQQV